MSDPSTNPAEPPVNDGGGGNTPQTDDEPTEEQVVGAEPPVNQGGGQWLNLTEASQGLADNWILALGRLPTGRPAANLETLPF